MAFLK
ncbi:7-cyano-7-deazaguanine synthase domain protein, partial [Yersinia pestis PY-101]